MDRTGHWEDRLALPVLLAALASVPAVFLTLFDDPYATVGTVVNWLSGAVLVSETIVLLAVSGDRWAWLRRHWLLVAFTLAVVAAVVLAIGPVQLLRLVRVFGAFRIVRAGRIVKAVRLLRRRTGQAAVWVNVASIVLAVLAVAFVAVVLADPTSASRELIDGWFGRDTGVVLVVVAGLLLAGATFVVARNRSSSSGEGEKESAEPESGEAEPGDQDVSPEQAAC